MVPSSAAPAWVAVVRPAAARAAVATTRATIRLISRFVPEIAHRKCDMGHTSPLNRAGWDMRLRAAAGGHLQPREGRASGGRRHGHNGWTDDAPGTVGARADSDPVDRGGGGIAA